MGDTPTRPGMDTDTGTGTKRGLAARRRLGALATLALAIAPACRHGGLGYGYEVHRVSVSAGPAETTLPPAETTYGRHRLKLIDLSGVFFSVFGTAASVRLEDPSCPAGSQGCTPTPVVDLGNGQYEYSYTARAVPIRPGLRFTLEYAWGGGEQDVTLGMTTGPDEVSYREYRMTVGLEERRDRIYFDFTAIDFTKRTLDVGDRQTDPFQWRMGLETGVILTPVLRAGAYLDLDMVSGVEALFGDHGLGYTAGLASALVSYPFIVEARVQREQLASQRGTGTGHGLVLSASLVY